MIRFMRLGLIMVVATAAGCGKGNNDAAPVDESTHVTATQQNGDVATVNGAISIDDNAKLGTAKTVNGDIYLGAHAMAASLATVNGAITADKGSRVSGEVTSVNGTLSLRDDSEVNGSLTNVNGKIVVTNAHVAGGITTVGGDVAVSGLARVDGGIWVKNLNLGVLPAGDRVPRVVIGPGATVRGEMRFEHKVKLFVSDRATVGSINGADAVKFSGDTPPP
jgi:cytoskeletal protein CcmA (bactofilin family)